VYTAHLRYPEGATVTCVEGIPEGLISCWYIEPSESNIGKSIQLDVQNEQEVLDFVKEKYQGAQMSGAAAAADGFLYYTQQRPGRFHRKRRPSMTSRW
jgi:hypothetical protein